MHDALPPVMLWPLAKVESRLFKSKAYVFDKYAKCKQTAPPDVAKYLTGNDKAVAWIRRMMEEDKTNKGADI